MSEPTGSPPPPPPPQPPLDYASPSSAARTPGREIVAGVLGGIVAVAAAGFVVSIIVDGLTPDPWDFHSGVAAGAFFATAAFGFGLFVVRVRNRDRRRWFFLSFLLGAGAMALMEGACFIAPTT